VVFEIRLENSLNFASDEYRALFERSRATAFQHPLWLDRLYRLLAPAEGATPLVVTARRRDDGRLCLVLPLMRRRRRGLRIVEFADLEISDYAAPICEDAALQALAEDARARDRILSLLKPFDLLRIKKVCDGARNLDRLFTGARCEAMDVSAHATALFAPFAEWRAARMPPSFAKESAKKRRQMERLGAFTFERLQAPDAIEDLLRDLQRFRGQRFPDDYLARKSYFDFYLSVALAGARDGFARAYQTSLDGRRLSGAWGICHQGRFLVLVSGFDATAYPKRSIGALTFEDVASDCIAQQDAVLDFTIGDEHYKRLFGTEPAALWMISACGTSLGLVADRIAARMVRAQPPGHGAPLPAEPAD
jgi:CelD/BcsL family acetyltransferase involved in cellulose biosynthesis